MFIGYMSWGVSLELFHCCSLLANIKTTFCNIFLTVQPVLSKPCIKQAPVLSKHFHPPPPLIIKTVLFVTYFLHSITCKYINIHVNMPLYYFAVSEIKVTILCSNAIKPRKTFLVFHHYEVNLFYYCLMFNSPEPRARNVSL